jgi:signal transduction histidine kinase
MASPQRIWKIASSADLSGRSWLRRRIPFVCHWQRDLQDAGVTTQPSWTFAFGVPMLALSVLAVMALTALLSPDQGGPTIWSMLLVLIAAYPWGQWLLLGDDGPSVAFGLMVLIPIALLAIGRWFFEPFSLGSDLASPLMAFPGLLLTALTIGFGPSGLAIVTSIKAYLAIGGPLTAAWLTDRGVEAITVGAWNVVFLMTVIASMAMLMSYRTSRAVADAREARAREAAVEERRQVARDVHDVLAHTLSVTMLHVTAARMAVLRSDDAQALEALEEAERHGRSSLGDVRRIVRLLRSDDSSAIDAAQPGLADIEHLVAGYRGAGLPVDFSMTVAGEPREPLAEAALFRVLQEALTNAARHGSGSASVTLSVTDDELALRVENPIARQAARRPGGSGLIGMRERIAAAGGKFEAGDREDRWEVRVSIPNGISG